MFLKISSIFVPTNKKIYFSNAKEVEQNVDFFPKFYLFTNAIRSNIEKHVSGGGR